MAFRSTGCLRTIASRLKTAPYSTATQPKQKAYNPTADHFHQEKKPKKAFKGDFVPVYVVLGMIAVSVSLGLYTATHHMAHSPNVRVKKKMRETIPEVVDPEAVLDQAEKFRKKSFFRKVAQVQEFDNGRQSVPDPIRKQP